MKNPLIRLREIRNFVGNAERTVAEYLLQNPNEVMECNIRELAAKIYVSPSTIVRLCKKTGFDGYRDFRQAVIYELALQQNNKDITPNDVGKEDSLEKIIEKITYRNIASLEETLNILDIEKFKQCVELIYSCRHLLVFGIGASQCVAKDAYLKFLRVNKICFVNEDYHSQLVMAQNAKAEDLAIIISYSGETEEMIKCMEYLKQNQTPMIAITRLAPSAIDALATYSLYTSSSESLYRSGAISSRITQLNMIDILYTAYTNMNYEECLERFSTTHIVKPNT